MAIDIVLTYVDGSTAGFAEEYRVTVGHAPAPCQVRTLGELRYVLRSIYEHVTWVRDVILLVNDRRHIPGWLNQDALRVVTVNECLPPESRPCFNPFSVQAWSHRIPGLAPGYLLWSDDQLALRPLHLAEFFDDEFAPRVPVAARRRFRMVAAGQDPFSQRLANSYLALDAITGPGTPGRGSGARFLASHFPVPISVVLWVQFLEEFRCHPGFTETILSRVREGAEEPSVRTTVLELWCAWLLARYDDEPNHRRWMRWVLQTLSEGMGITRPYVGFYPVRHDPQPTREAMDRMLRQRPQFACINDEAYDRYVDALGHVWHQQMELEPNSKRALIGALEALFPDPSPFELE